MCGSDLKFYRATAESGGPAALGLGELSGPVIAGHEPCGAVAALHPDSADAAVAVGDRVMVHHYKGCGHCEHCGTGWSQLCRGGPVVYGATGHGGHAPYMLAPVSTLVPPPRSAVIRDRRGYQLRNRHGVRRAGAARTFGARHHSHLRPGAGGAERDPARGGNGRASHRPRHRRRKAGAGGSDGRGIGRRPGRGRPCRGAARADGRRRRGHGARLQRRQRRARGGGAVDAGLGKGVLRRRRRRRDP